MMALRSRIRDAARLSGSNAGHQVRVQRLGRVVGRVGDQRDLGRGDQAARSGGDPVVVQRIGDRAVERAVAGAVGREEVGDELGMAFPFQTDGAEIRGMLLRVRRRMGRTVPIKQRNQVRQVIRAIPFGGARRLLPRQPQHAAGCGHRLEGPGVQFLGQRRAARMLMGADVAVFGHGAQDATHPSRTRLWFFAATSAKPIRRQNATASRGARQVTIVPGRHVCQQSLCHCPRDAVPPPFRRDIEPANPQRAGHVWIVGKPADADRPVRGSCDDQALAGTIKTRTACVPLADHPREVAVSLGNAGSAKVIHVRGQRGHGTDLDAAHPRFRRIRRRIRT